MKKIGKSLIVVALLASMLSLSSCATTNFISNLFGKKTNAASSILSSKELTTIAIANPKNYEVLGPVIAEAKSDSILFFISTHNSFTYENLLRKAQELYPECNAVVNIRNEKTSTLDLGLYSNKTGYMTGDAIRITDTLVNEGTTTIVGDTIVTTDSWKVLK